MAYIDPIKVRQAEESLYALLGPQLSEITKIVSQEDRQQYLIELPEIYTVDLTLEDIASLVARTSNGYVKIARFAGMARAEAKLAKGRFDRKYKTSKAGKNAAERDEAAMNHCKDEHMAMITAEAVADLADAFEAAARVASESARKIFDKAQAMQIGERRESHGSFRDSDFNTY